MRKLLCILISIITVLGLVSCSSKTQIADYKSSGEDCYATPLPGKYIFETPVKEARKHYEGKDVTFLLGIIIFKDGITSDIPQDEIDAEYKRLAELGYKFYKVKDHWFYTANQQKVYQEVIVGEFTEEQLNDFKANDKYGYYFFFQKNGDGSAISVKEDDLIVW